MPKRTVPERKQIITKQILSSHVAQIDRMFGWLLLMQWLLSFVIASLWTPYSYVGNVRSVHPHVYFALIGGALLSLYPFYLSRRHAGETQTRFVISVAQMLFGSLLIHIMNGRIETHFHVFGSLAFLAAYWDVRLLVLATALTGADHLLRGIFLPESVYGVLQATPLRALEHSAWVLFEDVILVFSIRLGIKGVDTVADKQANLEFTLQNVESIVEARTSELAATQQTVLTQQQTLITAAKMSALGEMAGGIAHEINTPLGSIALLAAELEFEANSGAKDPEFIAQSAGDIKKTVDRIGSIIKALRTFARDSQQDPMSPHNFRKIASETLDLCRERLASHGVRVIYDENTANLILNCRPTEISQILLNLLNNSLDAIEGLNEKWIRLECGVFDGEIHISVSDSGPGIPEPIAAKIMQPFFTTKEIGKGTGLGLSISRSIADAHGGRLELDRQGANTKFVLRLPSKTPMAA